MEYIYIGISIIIAIILHEMAHGYMSYWLGDSTAKQAGRLSINPLNHLDPVGTICLFLLTIFIEFFIHLLKKSHKDKPKKMKIA